MEHPAGSPTSEREEHPDGKSSRPVSRQFKLISVNLKEAALDLPSFRASVNHLDIQLDNIENWLNAFVLLCKRFPQHLKDIQVFFNSFLEHLVPSFLQDGLIDQEYTVQLLHTTLAGLKRAWAFSMNLLSLNATAIENLNTVILASIAKYKELRTRYEVAQAKYEKYLAIFMATLKTKDANMLVEDARELFKVRKGYIHACLDLVIELNHLLNKLDYHLVSVLTNLWRNKHINVLDGIDPEFRYRWERIQRIQEWCDLYQESMDQFTKDMLILRRQVEELAVAQALPSLDPSDYRTATINRNILNDINEMSFEKHGYLYMKTWPESGSGKPVWVRRWCFIKGGVFGMLVLAPAGTFVQETDKIGVLLANAKYYPLEDRRFCFEVKTAGLTVIFQAESLVELKLWLKVFDNERHRVIANPGPDNRLLEVGMGRFPPLVLEFALTHLTTADREFSLLRCTDSNGREVVSTNLTNHIKNHEAYFRKYLYYQIPLIRPPFMTGTTKTLIIAYLVTPPTALPTALTANIWGSVNWGVYYLHDDAKPLPGLVPRIPSLNGQSKSKSALSPGMASAISSSMHGSTCDSLVAASVLLAALPTSHAVSRKDSSTGVTAGSIASTTASLAGSVAASGAGAATPRANVISGDPKAVPSLTVPQGPTRSRSVGSRYEESSAGRPAIFVTNHSNTSSGAVNGTDLEEPEYSPPKVDPRDSHATLSPTGEYPSYYPGDLVAMDIQMRALFETTVEPGELCLVSFRCIWSPNLRQDLSGRCFITRKHIYFYMLVLGFVSLFKDTVDRMVLVDHVAHKRWDQLKIYFVLGSIKIKLFLDDGRAIQKKLIILITNATQNKSRSIEELLRDIVAVDTAAAMNQADTARLELVKRQVKHIHLRERLQEVIAPRGNLLSMGGSSLLMNFSPKSKSKRFRTDFCDQYTYVSVDTFNLSPKALFHALLGDASTVLHTLTFAKMRDYQREPWRVGQPPWVDAKAKEGEADNLTTMWRSFNGISASHGEERTIHVDQVVDNMYEEEYYTFSHVILFFKFFLGLKFRLELKFVIVSANGRRSKVYIYTRRRFFNRLIFNPIIDRLCQAVVWTHGNDVFYQLRRIVKEVGHHGMAAKAIYFYGKLTVTSEPYIEKQGQIIQYNFRDIVRIIAVNAIENVASVTLAIFRLIFRAFAAMMRRISTYRVILAFALLLLIVNVLLLGRSTINYWLVRNANHVAAEFVNGNAVDIQSTIYMADVAQLLESKFDLVENNSSPAFQAFRPVSFVLTHQMPLDWTKEYSDEFTRASARKLIVSMREIGVRRTELLTELSILNLMERDMAIAEYRNWLVSESARCGQMNQVFWNNGPADKINELNENQLSDGMDLIMSHCQDVANQLQKME